MKHTNCNIAITTLLLLAGTSACFRTEAKKVAVLAAAEETGPRAFSLNTPLVAARTEPVLLSWSPSTGATVYEVSISAAAGCTAPVFQQLGVVAPSVAVPALAEGAWHLCVTAKDDQDHRRVATNDGALFLVDRTPPAASVAGAPAVADGRALFRVAGESVAAHVFKAGPAPTMDCNDASGYSNALPVSALVEVPLNGIAQDWTFCVLGDDAAGNRQSLAQATVYTWHADPAAGRFAIDLPMVAGTSSLTDGNLVVKGIATPGAAPLTDLTVSLQHLASAKCLNAAKTAFDAPCPADIAVAGPNTWTIAIPAAVLAEGNGYEITVRGKEAATGKVVAAGHHTYHWVYGRLVIEGEGSRRVNSAVKAKDGAIILGGSMEGAIDMGAVKIKAPPEGTGSYDWLVAKVTDRGATLWAKRFIGPGFAEVRNVAVDASGDVFVLGITSDTMVVGDEPANAVGFLGGSFDTILVKLAGATGAALWTRSLSSDNYDLPGGLALDADGQPIVFGVTCGPLDVGDGVIRTPRGCDPFVATFATATGAPVWATVFESDGFTTPTALARAADGSLLLTGSFERRIAFGTPELKAANDAQAEGFAAKLDAAGKPLWSSQLTGSGAKVLSGIAADDTGVYVTGTAETGLYTAKLKPDGTAAIWTQITAKATENVNAYDLALDGLGGVHTIAGGDDVLHYRFAAATGAVEFAHSASSEEQDVWGVPRISVGADGELLIGITYGGALHFGDETVEAPWGTGAMVWRWHP